MTTKTIKLSKKYQDNIQDFKKEQDTVRQVIQNTFEKFQNESNFNLSGSLLIFSNVKPSS